MPDTVYKFRVLGMALGGIPCAVVLHELNASVGYWSWWLFSCYIWPHLAYRITKKGNKPFSVERNNLLFDSFIAGTWVAILHFNLLPSILLLTLTFADKISSGIKKLWLFSIPCSLTGILLAAVLTDFAFQPYTSMVVILACIPILLIHTFSVAFGSYQLIRKVQFQNKRYRELSQQDTLTPLYNRRYWQELVEKTLTQCNTNNTSATLILIDIDDFKDINDQFGHSAGDKIIKNIAKVITDYSGAKSIAGRIGGDEFAVVIPLQLSESIVIANNIRKNIENYKPIAENNLRCTVSIGLVETNKTHTIFKKWFDSADKYLYQSKNQGKNQITYSSSQHIV